MYTKIKNMYNHTYIYINIFKLVHMKQDLHKKRKRRAKNNKDEEAR